MKTRGKQILALALLACQMMAGNALAENESQETEFSLAEGQQMEEDGLQELEPLLAGADAAATEGLDLEQLTDAMMSAAMSEYVDQRTGFSFQYPAALRFSEEGDGQEAVSADGRLRMRVESMEADGDLTADTLKAVVRMENPEAQVTEYPENGCLRFDRTDSDGTLYIDLYLLTEHWLHHISLTQGKDAPDSLETTLGYMIYSITSNETEEG